MRVSYVSVLPQVMTLSNSNFWYDLKQRNAISRREMGINGGGVGE